MSQQKQVNNTTKARSLPELQEIRPYKHLSPALGYGVQHSEHIENIKFLHHSSEIPTPKSQSSSIIENKQQSTQESPGKDEYNQLIILLKEQIKSTNTLLQQQQLQQKQIFEVQQRQDQYNSQSISPAKINSPQDKQSSSEVQIAEQSRLYTNLQGQHQPKQVLLQPVHFNPLNQYSIEQNKLSNNLSKNKQPELEKTIEQKQNQPYVYTNNLNPQHQEQPKKLNNLTKIQQPVKTYRMEQDLPFQGTNIEDPPPNQATNHETEEQVQRSAPINQSQSEHVGVQERIPLPQYEIDPFRGKAHLVEFLQYLLKQKYILQVTNAPIVQQKILLNSKLPEHISNTTISQAYDSSISLEQYIDFLGKTFGPKQDNLINQVMNLSLKRYEHYLVFIQRITEVCSFANINQQQQIFILNLKLPKHVTSGTQNSQDLYQYQSIVKQNISQGWFDTVDTQYRSTLNFENSNLGAKSNYKGKRYQNKGQNENNLDDFKSEKQQMDKNLDTNVQTRVARIVVQDHLNENNTCIPNQTFMQPQQSLLTFAGVGDSNHQHNTRYKKRQHVDFQNQKSQNGQDINSQGTSQEHFQQANQNINVQEQLKGTTQIPSQQTRNESLQQLLDKIQQQQEELKQKSQINNNLQTQNQSQIPRAKGRAKIQQSSENIQQQMPVQKTNYYVLDPTRYINSDTGQVNISKVFNEVCIPTPVNYVLQTAGYQIVPKSDQSIPKNAVYANSIYPSNEHDVQSQNVTNTIPNFSKDLAFNSKFENEQLLASEQRIQNFFEAEVQILNNQLQNQSFSKMKSEVDNQFKEYISDEQHPKICVFINNIQVEGIIDTGAEQTLIDFDIVKKAGLDSLIIKQPKNQGVYVTGINGYSRMYGVIPRLELNIQGHDIIWQNIFVQEKPNFELLIGLDMLRIFSFIIELNPTRVSFVPTLDDPRIYLELLKTGSQSPIKAAFQKILYSTQKSDSKNNNPLEYIQEIEKLYPQFPIYNTYQILLIDPPWFYEKPMYKSCPPYPCLKFEQLSILPIPSITDRNGTLIFMWTTSSQIQNALKLFKYWDINFKGIFLVWKKLNLSGATKIGMGYYSRVAYEFLLLGTIGKIKKFRRKQSKNTTISQDLSNTSMELGYQINKFYGSKPIQVYDQIKRVFNIEQFAALEIFATSRNIYNTEYDLYGNQLQPTFQKQRAFDILQNNLQDVQHQYHQIKLVQISKQFDFQVKKDSLKPDIMDRNFETQVNVNRNNSHQDKVMRCLCNTIKNSNISQYSENILKYINNLNVGEISNSTFEKLQKLLLKFDTVFKFDNHFSVTNLGEVDVILKPHAKAVRMKPYKVVGEAYYFLKQKFQELLKHGLISIGSSEWATAVMCVPKDSPTEKYRAVQNFKKVNQQIIKDKYPLRLIDFILINVRNKPFISVVDMRGGFNQIRRCSTSKHIMAMILPFGQYIPEVMFFGETNAPSVFQRYVDMAIGDMYGKGVECYIDDIIIYANTEEEMLQLLEQLFIRLQRTNFKLHPEKCQFFTNSANILGHKIEGIKIEPKQKKVNKLIQANPPKNKKQLQQFLGSINYYRKFIPNLAVLFKPLQNLLPENVTFKWTNSAQLSYDIIQTFLQNQMQLTLPDINQPFKVFLSISNFCYSCALVQEDQFGEFVVAFQSQVCTNAQGRLNLYIREIDCMCWALNEFKPYLQHQHFVVKANYHALKFLYENKPQNLQILSYQLQLQDLSFEIEQVNGSRLKQLLLLTFLQKDQEKLDKILEQMEQLQTDSNLYNVKNQKSKNVGSNFKDFELILQFDGASQTGKFHIQIGAGAFVLYNSKKEILHKESLIFNGSQTNNCAEYQSLLAGLQFVKNKKWHTKKILIQGDSQLIIRQLTYVYMCNAENLQQLCMQARNLIKYFPHHKIEHIDRMYNSICDSMAKQQLRQAMQQAEKNINLSIGIIKIISFNNYATNLDYEIDIIKCQICQSEDPEETMLLCDNCNNAYHSDCLGLSDVPINDWYCSDCSNNIQSDIQHEISIDPTQDIPLIKYLKNELDINTQPIKTQERILSRAKIYIYYNNKLYKISNDSNPKEVPTVGEREILVEQIHQLVGHLGMNRTLALIRTTYYWPRMSQQIENTLRKCQLCQAHNPNYLSMPNTFPIKKGIIPLQAWYLDCFYLPTTPQGYTMAIIAICGTSKWVEGRPIYSNNSTETRDFLFDEIICRYGCPSIIITDRGSEFKGNFKTLIDRLGIIHYRISPEYPQSNGQVERMNRIIKSCLTKLSNSYDSQQYSWDQLLQQVLFGIRVTVSRSTKYSAFQILFAQDPIIPGFQGFRNEFSMQFQNEFEQEQFLTSKLQFRQNLGADLQDNLQQMEQEISDVISKRETIQSSNLQYGDIVFVKRQKVIFPQTKSEGPYLFIGYGNSSKTTCTLIHLRTSKIRTVNITKVNPIKLY